jgi:hypothetical protein
MNRVAVPTAVRLARRSAAKGVALGVRAAMAALEADGRCFRPYAHSAEKTLRYRSNRATTVLSTARIASLRSDLAVGMTAARVAVAAAAVVDGEAGKSQLNKQKGHGLSCPFCLSDA